MQKKKKNLPACIMSINVYVYGYTPTVCVPYIRELKNIFFKASGSNKE